MHVQKGARLADAENKPTVTTGKREAGRENEGQGMKRHRLLHGN